jgi:hypothetical protein
MQHAYIRIFFADKVKPSEQLLKKLRESSYGMVISKDDAAEIFDEITPGSELKENKNDQDENYLDPAFKLSKWQKYKHGGVEYTKRFHEKSEALSRLAASPLLPKQLTEYMYEFSAAINNNLTLISEVLTEASQEMQGKYTTAHEVVKFDPSWAWNIYNRRRAKC